MECPPRLSPAATRQSPTQHTDLPPVLPVQGPPARAVVSPSHRRTYLPDVSHTPHAVRAPGIGRSTPRRPRDLPDRPRRRHSTPSSRTDPRRAVPPPRHPRKVLRAQDLGGGGGEGGRKGGAEGGERDEEGLRGGRTAVGPPAGSFPPHAKPMRTDADWRRQSGRGYPIAALGFPVDGVDRPAIRRRRERYSDAGSR